MTANNAEIDPAYIAERTCEVLDETLPFDFVDWNDLGEITVTFRGKSFRACFIDITNEDDEA